jgi:predicted Mrr-cat superfamily restriction endonuclease
MRDLQQLLLQHYDRVDAETQALLPLRKIYWPARTTDE